jgi:carbon starvation protein
MNLLFLVLISIVLLLAGYVFYGQLLSKWLGLRADVKTPAHSFRNDVDFVPANEYYLLSQHLSAIAAAGPIVGPILAGMWFGWLPTFVWIVFGGIFIGGVHDMVTIAASIRHDGKSIAEVLKTTIGKRAYIIFLLFLWFSLIYIIAAFTDVTSSTFVEPTRGGAIASSSMLYLLLALVMGIVQIKWKPSLWVSTIVFFPFVFVCIFLGPVLPLHLPSFFGLNEHTTWNIALLIYCFIASTIPVWLLLQPRGYLGGFFLLLTAGVSFIGLLIGNFTQSLTIHYPAFMGWTNAQGLPLMPILFTTVACGACSGFHCLIASGTTSKQLNKETDARIVGYGSMMLESFVAVMALGTLLLLTTEQAKALKSPDQIYANGIATFLNVLGINKEFAMNFALLAFATFVYDTLDVATRLGRYIFEELTGWKTKWSAYVATLATLVLPCWFLTRTFTDAQGNVIPGWKMFWTVFGASNQLLAALVLFGLTLWLLKSKMKFKMTLFPCLFMLTISLLGLVFINKPWLTQAFAGQLKADPVAITSIILFLLTCFLIFEGMNVILRKRKESNSP